MLADFNGGHNIKRVYNIDIASMTYPQLDSFYNSFLLKDWSNEVIELMFNIAFYSHNDSDRANFFEAFGHTDLKG
jgi:hypothetical protein